MLKWIQKRGDSRARAVRPEQAAMPAGVSNQAMLENQREYPAARSTTEGTPLDNAMRAKFERQFGLPMDDVRIHSNSDKPASFDADAYTYGSDIFIGPGQEGLLEHEMTHVAQQKLGQVRPTGMENGMAVNRSPTLEHSADTGAVAQTMGIAAEPVVQCGSGKKGKKEKKAKNAATRLSPVSDRRPASTTPAAGVEHTQAPNLSRGFLRRNWEFYPDCDRYPHLHSFSPDGLTVSWGSRNHTAIEVPGEANIRVNALRQAIEQLEQTGSERTYAMAQALRALFAQALNG